MAERSTAAVDVAADSGEQPLTAEAQQTTTDGVTRSGKRGATSSEPDTADEAPGNADQASSGALEDQRGDGTSGAPPNGTSGTRKVPGASQPDEAVGSDGAPDAAPEPSAGPLPGTDAESQADPGSSPEDAPGTTADSTVDPAPGTNGASDTAPASGTEASGGPDGQEGQQAPVAGSESTRALLKAASDDSGDASPGGTADRAGKSGTPAASDTTTRLAPVPQPDPEPAGAGAAAAPDADPEPTDTAHAAAQKAAEEPTEVLTTTPDAAPADTPALAQEPAPKPSRVLDLHSGYRLARRYRLEECVTRLDGFSSWRAVDEKLRRAVGVHLLPAEHPRARSVIAAARSSALLGDPRFVQVLDAVEENDLVYVVQEWLPDATELTTLLASGPLEVHDAYQMVLQVAQAMTAAQRKGLAHLRLTPGAVLRTSTGQWRVRGLAVNAALRGITSATPERTDTEAIGALLYAALTQRWPYENDAYGLSGLPKDVGLIAPDQVRAGVHRGLSELAMRALVNHGATASRQIPPCTTPEELLEAIEALPKIRPPEPAFTPPSKYRRTTYQQGAYTRPGMAGPAAAPVGPPPAPLQSRTGKALKWSVSALLVVAIGLGSWQIAAALLENNNASGKPGPSQNAGTGKGAGGGKELKIAGAQEFTPSGSGIKENEVPRAVDGDPDTAWVTPSYYNHPQFGNYPNRRQGSGIIVDLGSVRKVTGVDLDLYRSGQKVEVLAAGSGASEPTSLSDFPQRLTKLATVGDHFAKSLGKPVTTRYVLVHITSLAQDTAPGQYRGGISEIKILGKPSE